MSGAERKATAVSPPPSADYDVEFRHLDDDAWYSVRTVLAGEKLVIKFQNFGDEEDCCFEAKNFPTFEVFEEFKNRFRPLSVQLQDWECRKVKKGVSVCISHSFNESDTRFFDAVVDDGTKYDLEEGLQEFNYPSFKFDSICESEKADRIGHLLQKSVLVIQHLNNFLHIKREIEPENLIRESSACLDPRVQHFLKIVREKLQREPCVLGSNNSTSFAPWLTQDTKHAGQVSCKRRPLEEPKRIDNSGEWTREDADLGGDRNGFTLLIDNLDKDLSPSTIVEFIHTQTSLSVQAFVFPSLASEMYTKGAIMVDSRKNLEELCKFLDCPNHIVMSKRGRPWVIAENLSGHGLLVVSIQTSMHKYKKKLENEGCSNALELVCSGTEKYKSGKRLVELFLEFRKHQKRLHQRLAVEEHKILQPTPAV